MDPGLPPGRHSLTALRANGLTVEYMGWMLRLFEGTAVFEDGGFVLSDRPGLGLTFNQQTSTGSE
jgi:L-alanine-DL-glutamate epimerase-like enolase superfamily enzyme